MTTTDNFTDLDEGLVADYLRRVENAREVGQYFDDALEIRRESIEELEQVEEANEKATAEVARLEQLERDIFWDLKKARETQVATEEAELAAQSLANDIEELYHAAARSWSAANESVAEAKAMLERCGVPVPD